MRHDVERAGGLGSRWGYAAPVLVAAGALMLGLDPIGPSGPIMITGGSLVMFAIFVVVWRRHASLFVATMTIGALAWAAGNLQWLGGAPIFRGVFWWLARHDVARRTVRQRGVTRFMAVCLLGGYVWLGVGEAIAAGTGVATPDLLYDALLHAVFLGFVIPMVFAHAPVIFPAVLGLPAVRCP